MICNLPLAEIARIITATGVLIALVALLFNWRKARYDKKVTRYRLALELESEAIRLKLKLNSLKLKIQRSNRLLRHLQIQDTKNLGVVTETEIDEQLNLLIDILKDDPDFYNELEIMSVDEIKAFAYSTEYKYEFVEVLVNFLQVLDRLAFFINASEIKTKHLSNIILEELKSALDEYSVYLSEVKYFPALKTDNSFKALRQYLKNV